MTSDEKKPYEDKAAEASMAYKEEVRGGEGRGGEGRRGKRWGREGEGRRGKRWGWEGEGRGGKERGGEKREEDTMSLCMSFERGAC